jgi:hypothetical protein
MISGLRVVAVVLVALLLVGGPLAPLARAQQPAMAAPAQPEGFQGTLKTPDTADASSREDVAVLYPEAYKVAAAVGSTVTIPLRLATCALGSGLGFAFLVISLGTGYNIAMRTVEEGCGGKWVLTSNDLLPESSSVTSTPEPR